MKYETRVIETPIGRYTLAASEAGLTHVQPERDGEPARSVEGVCPAAGRHVDSARRALAEYFAGQRRDFSDLALATSGSPFQQSVWAALRKIPVGTTLSYRGLGDRIGYGRATRAVGTANGANPVAIVVPCHRVIRSDGRLGGYGGGLSRKEWLLAHEGAILAVT